VSTTLPAARAIPGVEVRVGDVLLHLGKHRLLTEITPYTGPLLDLLGAETRVARSGDDWVIVLPPDQRFEVLRP
jgi:hypothetical protein